MRIATAAYAMDPLPSWQAYVDKLHAWVAEAAAQGADLLVFPEYGAMELAAISGQAGDLEASLRAVSDLVPQVDALHAELAARFSVHILAASAPVFDAACHPTRPVNRARLVAPNGVVIGQDKQIMTRFERETWDVVAGGPLRAIETEFGTVGVLICYDAEFPLLGRALIEAGCDMILVPSCTDTWQGYHRVRTGAAARALEGQCITVQSSTTGDCDWCPAVDENRGRAGVFAPQDGGMPDDGVLAFGPPDTSGWSYADIDLAQIRDIRQQGAVRGVAHWPEQIDRIARVEHITTR
ncbi:carbon-nitrogen hydrolase family protein [Shimia ponticola]|uniref:carbon-nitrogen hydrolase family protein n=1 Tax=Shimia ponticola TaxID=2582893 RepID=UPI0011BD8690|nr:carbon-nitrogen hydrolase family protein [Shimia ponticola]